MSEFSRLRGNEGYKVCDDEDDVAQYPGMKALQDPHESPATAGFMGRGAAAK